MGNKLLIIAISTSFILANTSYPDIDRLIKKVEQKRKGLDKNIIKNLKNPFVNEKKLKKIEKKIKLTKKSSYKKRGFNLEAIFNNKAKINGKWYKKGNLVQGFRLISIKDSFVILKKGSKNIKVFLNKKRNLIKIDKEKR